MPSTSAVVNRWLRKQVTPVLRDAGFEKADARNGWLWRDKIVCVFKIRAVGCYFADVTGWPPGSISAWLGAFYTFLPATPSMRSDNQGRTLPAEYECHIRSHLQCGINQTRRLHCLANLAERERKDIWWVDPDGANAEEVAGDIGAALIEYGLPWFTRVSNFETALASIEREHDCFAKFVRAFYLARELGDQERVLKYEQLAETEAKRIGLSLDRDTWQVTGI